MPGTDKLVLVADYFGVSIDYLLGRTENIKDSDSVDSPNNDLEETLQRPTLLYFGGEKLTDEDKEAVEDYIAGYLLNKRRKEALKKKK